MSTVETDQTIARSDNNWGRWGDEDERGTLNLLTPESVLAATRVPKTGKTYSLALPIQKDGVPLVPYRTPPQRFTLVNHTDDAVFAEYGNPDVGANEDVLVLASHNETHMDALCHVHHQNKLYNGFSAETMTSLGGASRCSIDKVGSLVGRAVLLDLVPYLGEEALLEARPISSDDLLGCAQAQGVEIRSGDILLVRTGWLPRYLANPVPLDGSMGQAGLGMDAVKLIRDRDIVAVGADNSAVEAIPFDGPFLAVHIELLVKLGVYLLEHLLLDEMAADRAYESLLVVAPLTVRGAAGSPINPIAIA